MEQLNSTHSEQDKNEVTKTIDPNEVHGQSGVYMFIFYTVSLLVIGSMIFHYLSLRGLFIKLPVGTVIPTETIININDAIPYGNLIVSLILYCLGTFGFEGTRSIIMSFDLTNLSEKAKNMPRYKRNRLIQMLITFILITILAMIFQMICINHEITKADFQLSNLTSGIGIFMGLLAYTDFGPKLSKQVGRFVTDIGQTKNKTEPKKEGDVEEKLDV